MTKNSPTIVDSPRDEDIERLGQRAIEWMESPEGSENIRKSLSCADKVIDKSRQDRVIDLRTLNEPVTI